LHLSNGDPVRPYITEYIGFNYDAPYYSGMTQNYHRNGRVSHPDQSLHYDNNIIPSTFSGWVNVVLMSDTGTNDNNAATMDGMRIIAVSSPDFSSTYQQKIESGMNYLDDETKGQHPIDSLKIGWYLGNNLLTGNTTLYYDDIYMDNTFSRVEIGNNSVYERCTHREIQIPISWKNDHIKFKANINAFKNGENLYLFVFNEDNVGNTSQGHPLLVRPFPTDGKATAN
jgi:hypothetical protein